MKLTGIWGYAMLATSLMGVAGGKTGKYVGGTVQYGSRGLRAVVDTVLITTENIGYGVKEVGKFVETNSQDLNAYANDYLAKEEYRNLPVYDFRGRQEDGWIIIKTEEERGIWK